MQMKAKIHKVGLTAIAVFMIGAGAIIVSPETPVSRSSVTTDASLSDSQTPVSTGSGTRLNTLSYTLAQVAAHNSDTSCWTAIDGEVYDLTPFIDLHPGGFEAILSLCGIDGSAAFDNQHGGQSRPANELAGLQIGTLRN